MDAAHIFAVIAQTAITYIVVVTISANNQKSITTEIKTELRTTKEDLMAEIKEVQGK